MTKSSNNSPLASALGIILDEDNAKSDTEKKRAIALNLADTDKANIDADYAREKVYETLQTNAEAIDELLHIAKESMAPRAYEVLGQLIKIQADNADKLLKIRADKQKVQNNAINLVRNEQQAGLAPGNTIINANNIAFVGSTTELLKMIKQEQNLIIDIDSDDVDTKDLDK